MNKVNYGHELSSDNKIQLLMNDYGRPDRGICYQKIEKLPLTKVQIDNAIVIADQVSKEKKLQLMDGTSVDKLTQDLINTYAGYAFLKELNFDVVFTDRTLEEIKKRLYPEVSVATYGYSLHDISLSNKRIYDISLSSNDLSKLSSVIVKDFYDIKFSDSNNYEDLKKATIDAKNKESVFDKVNSMRSTVMPVGKEVKNKPD